jgi:hypothetical protein
VLNLDGQVVYEFKFPRQYFGLDGFILSIDMFGRLRVADESLKIILTKDKKHSTMRLRKWSISKLPFGKLIMTGPTNVVTHFMVLDLGLDTTSCTRVLLKYLQDQSVRRNVHFRDMGGLLIPMCREYYLASKHRTLLTVHPQDDEILSEIVLRFCWNGVPADLSRISLVEHITLESFMQDGREPIDLFRLRKDAESGETILWRRPFQRLDGGVARSFQVWISMAYRGAELINSPFLLTVHEE